LRQEANSLRVGRGERLEGGRGGDHCEWEERERQKLEGVIISKMGMKEGNTYYMHVSLVDGL
jgi:hypothetical protein